LLAISTAAAIHQLPADRIPSMGNEEVETRFLGNGRPHPNDVGGGGVDISYAERGTSAAEKRRREEIKKRTLTLAGSHSSSSQKTWDEIGKKKGMMGYAVRRGRMKREGRKEKV